MKEKEIKTFSGKIIYDALQRSSYDVEGLAKKLNLSAVAIYNWFNGKRIISFNNAQKVHNILDIDEAKLSEAIKKDKLIIYDEQSKLKPKANPDIKTDSSKEINAMYDSRLDYELDRLKTIRIPVLGSVPAGPLQEVLPKMRHEADDYVTVSTNKISDPNLVFALHVQGESMIGRKIDDGDIIVIDAGAQFNNGDVVVAMVNDSATVKTFLKANDTIILQSANEKIEPIILKENDFDHVKIVGKVIKIEKEP
jgi:SOS-response transcriptional repressor LexA